MPAATKSTKSTFSLDAVSLERLNHLAERWRVSKTEVLRRALSQAEEAEPPSVEDRLAALHRLQKWAKDKQIDFDAWQKTIRDGRR